MIQGGDSAEKTGVKGGESIWGNTSFPDEFHPDNMHDKVRITMGLKSGRTGRRDVYYRKEQRRSPGK